MLRTLLLVSLIAFSLTACGNKGPLVLPDKTPPAPQTKDKDKPASTMSSASTSDSDAKQR